jgi:hypothetical protein
MHYIPSSQYTLEEIIEQCRSAIIAQGQYHKLDEIYVEENLKFIFGDDYVAAQ